MKPYKMMPSKVNCYYSRTKVKCKHAIDYSSTQLCQQFDMLAETVESLMVARQIVIVTFFDINGVIKMKLHTLFPQVNTKVRRVEADYGSALNIFDERNGIAQM